GLVRAPVFARRRRPAVACACGQAVTGSALTGPGVTGPGVTGPGVTAQAVTGIERARFAVPDELTCYYDRAAEPANVHIEVRVPGMLDESVFRASVAAVLSAQTRVLARRAATNRWRPRYY